MAPVSYTHLDVYKRQEPDTEYEVFIEQASTGKMKTNLGGKLSFSVELGNAARVDVYKRQVRI